MQKKKNILPQKTFSKVGLLRGVAALFWFGVFGIMAAFAIAPQTLPTETPVSEIVENIALPSESSESTVLETPPTLWHITQVAQDDTLASVLERVHISNKEAISFLRQSPDAKALASKLRPGCTLIAKTSPSGKLIELQYQFDVNHGLVVTEQAGEYVAEEKPLALEKHVLVKSGEIRSSLFGATDAADIPDQIATQLVNIFSSDIDFNLDLRRGDRFSIIYEASFDHGELLKTGRILSAEFINQGKRYQAILFGAPEGNDRYYTPDGKPLQKAYLRSPVEFTRISSGFTLARFHPILQTWKAHKGVDYAAPTGTRVKSVADAIVSFVGQQTGYGNVIILQHPGGINTVYGHLSHFASGLRKGQKVEQGQIIGYVGMTGMATGPHLHYEFRVHGEHRNPLTVALPGAQPLPIEVKNRFIKQSQIWLTQLNLLRNSNLASLE